MTKINRTPSRQLIRKLRNIVVYEPATVVHPVYSPEDIELHKRERGRQKAINERNAAEIEANRTRRAEQAKQQAIADALLDQSTRH